jgi:hypothetical protein
VSELTGLQFESESESQNYFTTGGLPPISSSWPQTLWDSQPELFFFQLNTCGHSPFVTSSLTRGWVCHLQLLLALVSAFILISESRSTHDHIILSQIRDSHNLVPRSPYLCISPRNRLTQLYSRVLGSHSVAFYNSQGYGGGNSNPPPHPWGPVCYALALNSRRTEYKT